MEAILRIALMIGIITAIVIWIKAIIDAPTMPESWNEETGEYTLCADCCWRCDDDYSFYGEPGPGCRKCPFCYRPGSGQK